MGPYPCPMCCHVSDDSELSYEIRPLEISPDNSADQANGDPGVPQVEVDMDADDEASIEGVENGKWD